MDELQLALGDVDSGIEVSSKVFGGKGSIIGRKSIDGGDSLDEKETRGSQTI